MSTKTLLTADDLWKIVADGSRYELSRGELVPMTPVGLQHSAIVGRLGKLLSNYVDAKPWVRSGKSPLLNAVIPSEVEEFARSYGCGVREVSSRSLP